MAGMKLLSKKAHLYLENIGAEHWSRHAFSPQSKSKMLTNNICESFNNVLKQARDKPILTHMEWMRKYVMQRFCSKREGVKKMEGRFMPYIDKQVKWAIEQIGYTQLTQSSGDLFEVEYFGERGIVDLGNKTCSCFGWELCGIPCVHAVAAIVSIRGAPTDYVEEWYTRDKYLEAYSVVIPPMPGADEWRRTPYPQPLPPPFKRMSGRPSKKKRKRQPGEDEVLDVAARVVGRRNRCSNFSFILKIGYNH